MPTAKKKKGTTARPAPGRSGRPGKGPSGPGPARRFPDWYPDFAEELADLFFSGTTSVFVLHGNVHDLVYCRGEDGAPDTWVDLSEFLATHVFGAWDVVFHYDLGRGLRPLAGRDAERHAAMLRHTAALGEPATWPSAPEKVFPLVDRFLERVLLRERGAAPPAGASAPTSVAAVLGHAQYLVPAADISSLAYTYGPRLVRLLEWAKNPVIKRQNIAFVLIADRIAEVDPRLTQNPHVAAIEIPLPGREERLRFTRSAGGSEADLARISDYSADALAEVSNGLSVVNLNVLFAQARSGGQRVDAARFRDLKKDMIERQCRGLLEFYVPSRGLDMVVGHEAAKDRLRADAALIAAGRLDFAPMGYLICGPVGTGKTFLAECTAGAIGIPCVKLLNFRSKYVGETEGNLEHVLTVLRSLGPVVVIIDEADAALGSREASGDAGTSSRVFSMIASQMGDTRYRGRILWMLLTSRPDLLPVDLKRQGRAEVHIPLFYPAEDGEFRAMFVAMARKNKVALAADAAAHLAVGESGLSGSDIESVVLAAHRFVLAAGRGEVTRADLDGAIGDFLPSAQGLEREAQELAAVLECTSRGFLPERWRERLARPEGRVAVQERLVAIRQILDT